MHYANDYGRTPHYAAQPWTPRSGRTTPSAGINSKLWTPETMNPVADDLLLMALATPGGFMTVSSHGKRYLPPHLQYLNELLTALSNRDITRLRIHMPPRHGKSELAAKYYPAWHLGMFPDERVIYASYSATQAVKFGRAVRGLMDEFGQAYFGVGLSEFSRAADRWDLEAPHQGGMLSVGVGGSITGSGAHVLIIDDPHKDPQEANSKVMRDKVWEWYTGTAYERLEPNGVIIVIHTRWHYDDFGGRLEKQERDGNGEAWTVVNFPAIAKDDDILGRHPGDALWPERYSIEDLDRIKANTHPYWFGAEYQQDPTPESGGIFHTEWFRDFRIAQQYLPDGTVEDVYILELPDGKEKRVPSSSCWRFSTIDLAVSTKTSADYTVMSTWAVTPDRERLLLDVVRVQMEDPDTDRLIAAQYEALHPGWLGVESVAYQLGKVQRLRRGWTREDGSKQPPLPVRPLVADRDKVSRAMLAATDYYNGRVYHRKYAAWVQDCRNELVQFPKGAHDDYADTDGYAAIALEQMPRPRVRDVSIEPVTPAALTGPDDGPGSMGLPQRSDMQKAGWLVG